MSVTSVIIDPLLTLHGTSFTMLSYAASASHRQIENYAGTFSELILVAIAAAALLWGVRSRRQQRATHQAGAPAVPTLCG